MAEVLALLPKQVAKVVNEVERMHIHQIYRRLCEINELKRQQLLTERSQHGINAAD
jgi:hypothetical protein